MESKPSWMPVEEGLRIELRMLTEAEFPDYAIALWELPDEFTRNPNLFTVETNPKEYVLAKNTDGEYHMVLFFDLVPDCARGHLEKSKLHHQRHIRGAETKTTPLQNYITFDRFDLYSNVSEMLYNPFNFVRIADNL
jgi:hypothetical protein